MTKIDHLKLLSRAVIILHFYKHYHQIKLTQGCKVVHRCLFPSLPFRAE